MTYTTRVIIGVFLFLLFPGLVVNYGFQSVQAKEISQSPAVDSASLGLSVKVAPGELLPISVKILNFGGGKRVDVQVIYLISSEKQREVYRATETIAVETTTAFVKSIQIPVGTAPGVYTATTSILYQGQEAPAITTFSFQVERKFLGLFQSQFLVYVGGSLFFSILMIIVGYGLFKHRASSRLSPISYATLPRDERVFYELISDTIMSMRQRVGDKALDIAMKIEGLEIDEETGRVTKLTRSPSKIIAELVLGYEKTLGRKVSFSFRKP